MAQGDQEQDRTEPATPFRLREARKRGQVAKSMELNSFLLLSAGLGLAYAWGESTATALLGVARGLFSRVGSTALDVDRTVGIFAGISDVLFDVLWLLALAVLLVAVLANLVQVGPILSVHPLKPDFNRLNPAPNLKRIFSTKLLFETIKTILKLVLLSGVLYLAIDALMPVLVAALDRDPVGYAPLLLDAARGLTFKLLLVLLLVAMADLLYTRWDYAKNLRMSRREIKEELRRREGDPLVRAKMRELQKEAAKRAGSLRRVPDADVLITNPTHLSIALRYDRGRMAAPVVLAKGAGDLALKMRDVARRAGVAVVEDRALARSLFRTVAVEQMIREEHYPVVARVLARVFDERRRRATAAAGAV